ncbi:MAG: alpha-glucan family phosphorylase [Gammaproteobacteria bacterium]
MSGTRFSLEVQPAIPERLCRLEELANDLLYSWDTQVRSLFHRLDTELWNDCGHNPKVFLRRVAQQKLEAAADDRIYIQDYNRVLSSYDTYHQERCQSGLDIQLHPENDLVAYFCAEFGFHESFPIYSGGLGILAGDHCKAASDLGIPFVAVGLLYRQGYFKQTIDGQGNQIAHYFQTDPDDLPITPVIDSNGKEVHVSVAMHERTVELKVWKAKAGHITLYLLDSDVTGNSESDRGITHQLYGGDINTRIQQEIVLGIGGVRALRAAGISPTVWHINEGHSAFQILERCKEVVDKGKDFESALELVAAATVFTTHTPVPAGHDIFQHELIIHYFHEYIDEMNIDKKRFLSLGAFPGDSNGFNMTTLALQGSRFHNGVSRIHGGVASQMEHYIWPQISPEENPIDYVTNGVHVPTFLAREWGNLFDMHFGGGWRNELLHEDFWDAIDDLPDHSYWSVRQSLKSKLFDEVNKRVTKQYRRNGYSPTQIDKLTRYLTQDADILTVGFARRFATYKRAALLFSDPDRLARLVNNPERPVIFIFAGKAHPHDVPGQQLLKTIHDLSLRPEFEGKIILVEDYDMALARKLVTGVDVWLNTPEFPLEASGTSGEKAGINGVLNLSVLDGWWGEGYNGENGWAITPHGPHFDADFRNWNEANELMDLLENKITTHYYKKDGFGHSDKWVKSSKASMKSLMPRFNSQRMVMDYISKFYRNASKQSALLSDDNCTPAKTLANWKRKVKKAWPSIHIKRADTIIEELKTGEVLPIEIKTYLNGLSHNDVIVECLVGTESDSGEFVTYFSSELEAVETKKEGETVFRLDFSSPLSGLQYYKIRIFPYHKLLSHRFELGCMLWV